MLSHILNRHPRILSLSEFFTAAYVRRWYRHARRTGDQMWEIYAKPTLFTRRMAETRAGEVVYPFDRPGTPLYAKHRAAHTADGAPPPDRTP